VVEKPRVPPSPYAVIGVYFYDSAVFDVIAKLKPSRRGELEITDVTNHYLSQQTLTHGVLSGWWSDAGAVESLHRAAELAARTWFRPGCKAKFWGPFDLWVEELFNSSLTSDSARSRRGRKE
jgi:glucose-1-phosphate thymidylyltransferase